MGDAAGRRDSFGAQLRQDRMAAGLTQEELAEVSGLSVRAIGDMERGRTSRPRPSTLRQIAQALSLPAPGHEVAEPARPVVSIPSAFSPRELPAPVRHFIGRDPELAALNRLRDQAADHGPETVVISAIGGAAGVGKTALAVRWAHQVQDQFPDGQLYVNLRGYDPGQPVSASDALAGFLRALGMAGQDIPAEADECAARYRSLLAGRRMLILLDNARDAEQVRPLLPATPGCMALVTSRDALAGLVARDGAQRLDLEPLTMPDAVGLLQALIGGRIDDDPGAAATLAAQCSRLPLALRIAAELAAARPAVSVAELTTELANQQRRLDLLDADGDPRVAVRAVFSWSYQRLDIAAACAFRLLGLHPGPDFDPYVVATLTRTTIGRARRVLNVLARAHLIQPSGPGRHGMHDLLRAYAAEQAVRCDSEQVRRAALTRLFDHYLATAAAAMDTVFPAEQPRLAGLSPLAGAAPPVTDQHAAKAWLDAERATVVAVAAYTADHGWPGHTTRLATVMFRYLECGSHYAETVAVYGHARRAACQAGDRIAEAEALNNACLVDLRQGRYQQAAGHLEQALALYQQTGNLTGQAYVLGNLGIVDFLLGRYPQAIDRQQQALARYRQTGGRAGEGRTLTNLGLVELRLGRYQQASGDFRRSLDLCRQAGVRSSEAHSLTNLGLVDLRRGHYQQAIDRQQQALAILREVGDQAGEAEALLGLGAAELRRGRHEQGADHHRQALALFRKFGDPAGEAEALNGLGEAFLAIGDAAQACARHAMALSLASQIGDKYQEARAHHGLARGGASGDPLQVRRHRQQALALYTDLGVPEASLVHAERRMSERGGQVDAIVPGAKAPRR